MKEAEGNSIALWRRVAAMFYDSLLLGAVLIAATALVLPFNKGVAISPGNLIFLLYLLAVSYLYFGWFWTHGGQTLPMKVWRLRALGNDDKGLSWGQAAIRFAMALISWLAFGMGFWSCLWNPNYSTWHDRCSGTKLILVRKSD